MKRLLTAIVILSSFGAIVATYGLWQHDAPVGSSICTLSEKISCDIVNKSPWSEVFGFPVAGIGLVGFAVLAALALRAQGADGRERHTFLTWLFALSVVGFVVQAYLTYIEFWIIGVACPICVSSQIAILGTVMLAGITWKRSYS
jgi:vitamin-K-epoxide reductase (warfarin-sensitive)